MSRRPASGRAHRSTPCFAVKSWEAASMCEAAGLEDRRDIVAVDISTSVARPTHVVGPFSDPEHYGVAVEDSPRRVRVFFNNQVIADSRRVKLLHETRHLPVYYFPLEDVRQDLLIPTEHTTHCPYKGDA